MADEMAAQFTIRVFPTAIRLRAARQPGVDAKHVEQAIGIKSLEIADVRRLRLRIGAVEQHDLTGFEKLDGGWHRLDRRRRDRREHRRGRYIVPLSQPAPGPPEYDRRCRQPTGKTTTSNPGIDHIRPSAFFSFI